MSEFSVEFDGSHEERKPILSALESNECNKQKPNTKLIRLAMLFLQYCIIGGLNFCIDMPGGLETTIIKVTVINATQYNVLFSAYAWPDILMPIIGGMIVDRVVGMRSGYIIFTTILMIGQGILAVGGCFGMFWVMLFGRIVFGCGIGTVQSLVTGSQVLLFDRNTALIIAINAAFMRLCAGSALLVSQRIYDSFGFLPTSRYQLGATLGVGFVLIVCVLLSAIGIVLLDSKAKRLVNGEQKKGHSKLSVWKFSLSYWLVVLIGSFFYPVVFSLVANGQLFFVSKYLIGVNEAGLLNSLNYASTIFLSPFLGTLISLYKRNSVWMMCGVVIGISSHVLFMSSSDNVAFAYTAAILISLAYSFVACAQWPLIGRLAKPHQLTSAFGITMAAYNLFYTLLTITQGRVIDAFGFFFYEIINMQFLWITVFMIVLLWIEEISQRLSKPKPLVMFNHKIN